MGTNTNGFPVDNAVDGANWPANTWLTIRIESADGELLFTGDTRTDQAGHFFQGVGVDLVPGMTVVIDGCLESESTTIVPMTIDVIDQEKELVSGTAPGGTEIQIVADTGGQWNDLSVVIADDGRWQASYAGKFDIISTTVIQATALDDQGNGTAVKIQAGLFSNQAPVPPQTSKPTSTKMPEATMKPSATPAPKATGTPSPSPTVLQTVGEKIGLPFSTGVTHIQFKAGAPFYIQHGWAEAADPLTMGLGFELEVDGIPRDEDAIIRTVGADGTISEMWTYNYPRGMSGTHVFKGIFLSTCQYALNDGRVTSCANPADIVVFGTRTLTVDFIP